MPSACWVAAREGKTHICLTTNPKQPGAAYGSVATQATSMRLGRTKDRTSSLSACLLPAAFFLTLPVM